MKHAKDCWEDSDHDQIVSFVCDDLWRYTQKFSKEKEIEEIIYILTKLEVNDLQRLAEIRFILAKGVWEFISVSTPKIINRLSKISQYDIEICRSQLHGRIDWQRTIAIRPSFGNSKNVYAVASRNQIYDLPENRLFLYVLKEMQSICQMYTAGVEDEEKWYEDADRNKKWTLTAKKIELRIKRVLANPFVKKIGTLKSIDENIIELTKKNRNRFYRDLAIIADNLLMIRQSPIAYLKNELQGKILEPLNWDTLFEIAILFKLIEAAKQTGWSEQKIGLIGGRNKFASVMSKDELNLEVFTQTLPEEFQAVSFYGSILDRYGMGASLRRPDIILKISNQYRKKFIIIEIKRSMNRKYLVDGTYKLLGYLKDFAEINHNEDTLTGILVAWNGVKEVKILEKTELLISTWNNFKEVISAELSLI